MGSVCLVGSLCLIGSLRSRSGPGGGVFLRALLGCSFLAPCASPSSRLRRPAQVSDGLAVFDWLAALAERAWGRCLPSCAARLLVPRALRCSFVQTPPARSGV